MNPSASPLLHKASVAAIALLLASGAVAVAVVCCRSLYADGAYRLLIMLTTDDIMRGWPSRLFADCLTDYPVVAAIDFGVRSLRTLAILFTISLLYVPLLAYSAAIWIAKDDRMLWTTTLRKSLVSTTLIDAPGLTKKWDFDERKADRASRSLGPKLKFSRIQAGRTRLTERGLRSAFAALRSAVSNPSVN